jgi:hypothetical protein
MKKFALAFAAAFLLLALASPPAEAHRRVHVGVAAPLYVYPAPAYRVVVPAPYPVYYEPYWVPGHWQRVWYPGYYDAWGNPVSGYWDWRWIPGHYR